MALLTSLPLDAAAVLLQDYEFELIEISPLSAGSVNSNFFIAVKRPGEQVKTHCFARIFEEQGTQGAQFELLLNEALFRVGIPVARPVPTKTGDLSVLFEGKPFAIYERLSGNVTCQKQVTPGIAFEVGAALAAVHCAPLGNLVPQPGRFGLEAIEARLAMVEAEARTDLYPAVERVRSLKQELMRARGRDLPSGLIHGDLFRDNLLIKEGKVSGILDFESACYGPFVYDLMVTLLAWCFGDSLEPKLTGAMVEGYCRVRPLSQVERNAMVVEGSVACARFAATRLTDFSLRAERGEKPVRDFERFFQRLDALRAGALDSLTRVPFP